VSLTYVASFRCRIVWSHVNDANSVYVLYTYQLYERHIHVGLSSAYIWMR